MAGNTRLDWVKFGVESFLLSLIASATCACARSLNTFMFDVFNIMSMVLLWIGILVLIAGFVGAALVKKTE